MGKATKRARLQGVVRFGSIIRRIIVACLAFRIAAYGAGFDLVVLAFLVAWDQKYLKESNDKADPQKRSEA